MSPSLVTPIFEDIFGEVREIGRQRKEEELRARLARKRKRIQPYITGFRKEVVGNWEFYLTLFALAWFAITVWRKLRK